MYSEPDDFPDSVLANLRSRVAGFETQQRLYEFREQTIAQTKHHLEQQVASGRITTKMAAELIESVERTLKKPLQPTVEEIKAAALFQQFKTRQASRPPDFAALYQRKQELDGARDQGTRVPEF
jgi:hypothetical protein